MRNLYLISLLIISSLWGSLSAQDLPLYSQKLTNSFLYNPSVAGRGLGSATFSNRRYWNGVPGAPQSNFLSVHMPFAYHKVGVGFNLMSDNIGAISNIFLSGAFSYHLSFNDDNILSFGVSSEYNNINYNLQAVDARDEGDPWLLADPVSSLDFSFGVSFRSKFFDVGISSNRLAAALEVTDITSQLSEFYTAYANLKLPLTKDHLIEPTFIYRQLSPESAQWDAGMYYSFRESIILGGSYRQEGIITATTALRFYRKFLVGYSFEMFGTGIQRSIGGTNEITLRMDFMDDAYARNVSNSREVMAQSIAFRRKTMSTSGVGGRKPVSASSKKFKKKLKRNYTKSPSYRMNNSSKLNTKKSSKRRKSNVRGAVKKNKRGGLFNNKKKRKTNYKRYSNKKRRRR